MRIYNRKQLFCVILTSVVLQILWMGLNLAWGDGRIDNISLKKEGDYTQVTIYGDRPFEFSHSIEGVKDGKLNRLIIDCQDMLFNLPQHDFKSDIPQGFISAIRTSQFQVDPRRIVRIVLDLKSTATYKVLETGSEKKATLAILTKQEPDFPLWLAVKESPKESPEEKKVELTENMKMAKAETGTEKTKIPGMKAEKPGLVTSTETSTKLATITPETQLELPVIKNTSDKTITDVSATKNIHAGKTHIKTVSYADTGETIVPQKKEPLLVSGNRTQVETKGNARTEKKEEATITTPTGSLPASKTTDQVSSAVNERPPLAPLPNVDTKNAGTHQAKQNVLTSRETVSPAPVQAQPSSNRSTVFSAGSTNSAAPPSPGRAINRSPVPLGPYQDDKTYTKKSTENASIPLAQTETGSKAKTGNKPTTATGIESSVKKGIGAVLGTKEVAAEESDSLLTKMLMSVQNPLQIDLGVIPNRKIITYNPETTRDPFLPLTEKEDMQFGEAPLPQFENLKLVGIIKDTRGNEALLEDEIGFGYILRSGDKIKNGYVMSVEDNKAIFHVEDYGGYRIMTLELNPEY